MPYICHHDFGLVTLLFLQATRSFQICPNMAFLFDCWKPICAFYELQYCCRLIWKALLQTWCVITSNSADSGLLKPRNVKTCLICKLNANFLFRPFRSLASAIKAFRRGFGISVSKYFGFRLAHIGFHPHDSAASQHLTNGHT